MTLFDWAVVAVLVVSGLLALARGFVREALSIAGWVAAAFAAIAAFPALRPVLRDWIAIGWVADVIAAASVFLVVLVIVSVLSGFVAERIHETEFKGIDRTLGFVFGLARGALLVCLGYLLALWVFPPDEQPDWLRDARTRPVVERGATILAGLVPEDMKSGLPLDEAPAMPEIDPGDVLTPGPGDESSTQAPPTSPGTGSGGAAAGESGDTADGPGYTAEDREELDELIEQQTE